MSTLKQLALRWSCVALAVTTFLVAGQVHATIVTLSSDHLDVMIGPGAGPSFPDSTSEDVNFSTHGFGPQETLVLLSNPSLLAALQTALGPDQGRGYKINSATLTVGSRADDYAPSAGTVTGHLVLQSYNPAQVTWNSRSTGTPWTTPGMLAGTDYASANATTATPTPGHISTERDFSGLAPVLQGWLNNTIPDFGLVFVNDDYPHAASTSDFTAYQNVVWTLDASIVPEPSTVMLIGLGGLLLFRVCPGNFGRRR